MSKKDIIEYLIQYNMEIPVFQVFAGMCVALFLGLCIYMVYKKTYTGILYSREFNATIVIIAMITTLVIMIIGSNLALSLGLVGALSIIRFRTAVKEPKDAAYLFWAIGVGLSCGTGVYTIGVVSSAFIAAVLLLFHSIKTVDERSYLLMVRGSSVRQQELEDFLKPRCKRLTLRMSDLTPEGAELTYEVLFKPVRAELPREIKEAGLGVEVVHLISYQGEIVGE